MVYLNRQVNVSHKEQNCNPAKLTFRRRGGSASRTGTSGAQTPPIHIVVLPKADGPAQGGVDTGQLVLQISAVPLQSGQLTLQSFYSAF